MIRRTMPSSFLSALLVFQLLTATLHFIVPSCDSFNIHHPHLLSTNPSIISSQRRRSDQGNQNSKSSNIPFLSRRTRGDGILFASPATPPPPPSLKSVFAVEDNIPPGLRGEAVRNAMSTRGICIDVSDNSRNTGMNTGIVKISGKGTCDFLNNKLTNSFHPFATTATTSSNEKGTKEGMVKEACLLTPRGRVVDWLSVACFMNGNKGMDGFIMTSPHIHDDDHGKKKNCDLFNKLDPFVFPMDEVKLTDCTFDETTSAFVICHENSDQAKKIVKERVIAPFLAKYGHHDNNNDDEKIDLPSKGQCIQLSSSSSDGNVLSILHGSPLFSSDTVSAYTILLEQEEQNANDENYIWESMNDFLNGIGPLPIAALEWDTLRIEHAIPALDREFMGDAKPNKQDADNSNTAKSNAAVKVNPLELNLGHTIDFDKGCYLGQEGVAAILKNSRGVPRTLYKVQFLEDDNDFEEDDDDDAFEYFDELELGVEEPQNFAATAIPQPGMELFLLGSNNKAKIGVLTSIECEVGGTGQPVLSAMALVRRKEYVLQKLKEFNLDQGNESTFRMRHEVDKSINENAFDVNTGQDQEEDALDGLEVICGGSCNAVGRLCAVGNIANALRTEDSSLFDDGLEDNSSLMGFMPTDSPTSSTRSLDVLDAEVEPVTATTIDDDDKSEDDDEEAELSRAVEEASKAAQEAQMAADEAQRKQQKMEMLKQRAEAAMAARKQKKQQEQETQKNEQEDSKADAEAEAVRKEKKMEMLKQRAEAAMAKRKGQQKKQ